MPKTENKKMKLCPKCGNEMRKHRAILGNAGVLECPISFGMGTMGEEYPKPQKKYQIIYADPPWRFEGNFGKIGNSKLSGYGAGLRYPLINDIELLKLPVIEISDKNCALFLWVVNSRLDFGIEVLKQWGFKYKQVAFCWVKTSQKGVPNCRLGYWTLGGIELCLLGIKGNMGNLRKIKNIRQVLLSPRIGHSKKPLQIRKNIELLFGDLPRIELFARQKTEGWDVWGNEVKSDIEL